MDYSSTEDGAVSLDVSCANFTLTDLGDEARRLMKGDGTRPAAFHNIVKGYARDTNMPEIMVTYKVGGVGASDPTVSLGFYNLNMFGLVRPMVELLEFVQGGWSVGDEGGDTGQGDEVKIGAVDSAVRAAVPKGEELRRRKNDDCLRF